MVIELMPATFLHNLPNRFLIVHQKAAEKADAIIEPKRCQGGAGTGEHDAGVTTKLKQARQVKAGTGIAIFATGFEACHLPLGRH